MQAVKIRHALCKLIFIISGFFSSVPVASECPAIPAIPAQTDDDLAIITNWQGVASPWSIRYTAEDGLPVAYGIGYLEVLSSDRYYYDWPLHIVLPIWSENRVDSFTGWIINGRVKLIDTAVESLLTGAGMVETEYEHNNFIVWKKVDDGWIQIRTDMENPPVWTHQCYLQLGDAKLEFQTWESFVLDHSDWLHFRDDVPHRLRSAADINSEQITMIGLDHKLTLLELSGDWMRVKVQQPDWTCTGPDQEFTGTVHEGWVKWRDERLGPWVWVYTRGC